jgi:hypothetical protein
VTADWLIRMTGHSVEDEAAAAAASRQRRTENIMKKREDRLAKIMSLASGRAVDPKEIHLDRTPSPTVSERAAAGVGPLADDSDSRLLSISNITPSNQSTLTISGPSKLRHTLIIIGAALLFCLWHSSMNSGKLSLPFIPETATPWQVLYGAFSGVELFEVIAGRVSLFGAVSDLSIYLFVILCVLKILG